MFSDDFIRYIECSGQYVLQLDCASYVFVGRFERDV